MTFSKASKTLFGSTALVAALAAPVMAQEAPTATDAAPGVAQSLPKASDVTGNAETGATAGAETTAEVGAEAGAEVEAETEVESTATATVETPEAVADGTAVAVTTDEAVIGKIEKVTPLDNGTKRYEIALDDSYDVEGGRIAIQSEDSLNAEGQLQLEVTQEQFAEAVAQQLGALTGKTETQTN